MRYFSLIIGSILILTSTGKAQDENLKSEIQQMNDKMALAIINNNTDELADMYAEDAVSLPSYSPMMKGKKEVVDHMREQSKSGNKVTKAEFETVELRREGNIAVEVGTYDMTMDLTEMEDDWSDTGKYITVWEKQGNDWKILYEIWNTDTNPWAEMKEANQNKEME